MKSSLEYSAKVNFILYKENNHKISLFHVYELQKLFDKYPYQQNTRNINILSDIQQKYWLHDWPLKKERFSIACYSEVHQTNLKYLCKTEPVQLATNGTIYVNLPYTGPINYTIKKLLNPIKMHVICRLKNYFSFHKLATKFKAYNVHLPSINLRATAAALSP